MIRHRKIHDALVAAVSTLGAEYVTTKIDRQIKGARSIVVSVMRDKRNHTRAARIAE
jgi:hypothetical protein